MAGHRPIRVDCTIQHLERMGIPTLQGVGVCQSICSRFTGNAMVSVYFYVFRFCLTILSAGDMIMKC